MPPLCWAVHKLKIFLSLMQSVPGEAKLHPALMGLWASGKHSLMLVVSMSATLIPHNLQYSRWNQSMYLAQRWSCWLYWFTITKTDRNEIKKSRHENFHECSNIYKLVLKSSSAKGAICSHKVSWSVNLSS